MYSLVEQFHSYIIVMNIDHFLFTAVHVSDNNTCSGEFIHICIQGIEYRTCTFAC